jgi:hypothetical protein
LRISTSRIIAATLLGPNEQHWDFCREAASAWADEHVVLEDPDGDAWGSERGWRAQLWDMAMDVAQPEDWIFILDADFILTFDPHELTRVATESTFAWRFNLHDLWSPTTYRSDNLWYAHTLPRHWMFHAGSAPAKPEWNPRGIHVGHYPTNFFGGRSGYSLTPSHMSILHLGWLTPEIRQRKYDRYKEVWHQLSDFERGHVNSVLAENPNVVELPKEFQKYLKEFS